MGENWSSDCSMVPKLMKILCCGFGRYVLKIYMIELYSFEMVDNDFFPEANFRTWSLSERNFLCDLFMSAIEKPFIHFH
jgi:hypothetical protein